MQSDHHFAERGKMNQDNNKNTILLMAGIVDAVISGAVLLIYFGVIPVDISNWGISRSMVGIIGGIWFIAAVAMLAYYLPKKGNIE